MAKTFIEFRVFIASPDGLKAEREAFRDTLLEYNAEVRNRNIFFTPVGWEETLGGHRRPQDKINQDLVTCDYFVLLLWDRWGSPPGKSGQTKFSSGCEEEFELALACLADERPMKEVVAFFKQVDERHLQDPGSQLQQVIDFRRQLQESKKHLFMVFDHLDEFQKRLRRFLAQWTFDHEAIPVEHPQILERGVSAWNAWRTKNPNVIPILSRANLSAAYLSNINMANADLSGADLTGTDLVEADLSGANLTNCLLVKTNLFGADLRGADLSRTMIIGAHLKTAKLAKTVFADTVIAKTDLSVAIGIDEIEHKGPSIVGMDTLYDSRYNFPEGFLRKAGVPELLISTARTLNRTARPAEFYSCFISYSSKDQEFASRLHADLQSKGVRCWFAPEDLKIGDKLRLSFDDAIRLHDKLIVVLSENSISSSWVEKEVETAFEREHRQNRAVLFPIRLDDAVMETDQAWVTDIRRTRHIGDFRDWKTHEPYKKAFDGLLRDLKAEDRADLVASR